MPDRFTIQLYCKFQKLCPLATLWIDGKCDLPLPEQMAVVAILLEAACKYQNVGPIVASRTVLSKIPAADVHELLPSVVRTTLDLDDEWEYRRLLEVLQVVNQSGLLAQYIVAGKKSSNPEVREAALEFEMRTGLTAEE